LSDKLFFELRNNELIKEYASQSVSQPVSQSVSQPVRRSFSQSASQPVSQEVSHPVRRSFSQPVSQPASQSARKSGSQAVIQSVSQSARKSGSQSVSQPVHHDVYSEFELHDKAAGSVGVQSTESHSVEGTTEAVLSTATVNTCHYNTYPPALRSTWLSLCLISDLIPGKEQTVQKGNM
jgi:hypothetical protein